ncbi:MAG: caspase family protein [Pseudomonadota bacterium]
MFQRLCQVVSCLAVAVALAAASAQAEDRIALVIGNGDYAKQTPLVNPANDANDLAATLQAIGFEVERHENIGYIEMLTVLKNFQYRALAAEVAIVYYSGHGLEIDRSNYLIPVDATLNTDRDVPFEAVPLQAALLAVEGAAKLSLVIVDACRDNPFLDSMRQLSATKSLGKGLGHIEPAGNTLVAYAAREGTVAYDGEGRNSPYARALIAALQYPGLEVGKLFRVVRDSVLAETEGRQEPFLYGSLSASDFFLNPPEPPAPVDPPPAPNARGLDDAARADWAFVKDTTSIAVLERFIATHPDTVMAALAQERIAILRAGDIPPSAAAPAERAPDRAQAPDTAPLTLAEIAYWNSIEDSMDPRDFSDYLARYPEGIYVSLARRRLAQLNVQPGLPPTTAPEIASAAPRQNEATDPQPEAPAQAPAQTRRAPPGQREKTIVPVPLPPRDTDPSQGDADSLDATPASLAKTEQMPLSWIQTGLKVLGHYRGRVDGLPGPRTSQAIRAFLRENENLNPAEDGGLEAIGRIVLIWQAAKTGDDEAMRLLGLMYMVGMGVERDRAEAEKLLRAAVERGNTLAEGNLEALLRP